MNGKVLFVFIILLSGLILCSFLGGSRCLEEGMETMDDTTTTTAPSENNVQDLTTALSNVLSSADASAKINDVKNKIKSNIESNRENKNSNQYDNYNHFDKMANPIMYYGPDGGTARVITTPNNNTIVITYKNGTTHIYYIDEHAPDPTTAIYHGPNGGSAKIITGNNGKQVVQITSGTGSKIIYTSDRPPDNVQQDDTLNQYDGNTNTTGSDYDTAHYPSSNYNGIQSNTISGPSGNTYSTYDSSAYFNSLPQGVPRSQIPFGQEDLYILKTQVVPPVCPAPTVIYKDRDSDSHHNKPYNYGSSDATKCPPCPACQRCPEPSFECKKVPNYASINQDFMPMPVLGDFSTFGM
jgi:hypothetical protein